MNEVEEEREHDRKFLVRYAKLIGYDVEDAEVNKMVFRFRWKQLGGHVHIRIFAGRDWDHLAKSGDMILREDARDLEFTNFKNLFRGNDRYVDFVKEEGEY
jgi:hypothetical protein